MSGILLFGVAASMGPVMPYLFVYPFEICHGQFLEDATVSWTRVGARG